MRNIIIVLVSDQTIPNVLFIKEFIKDEDEVLFISTERMTEREEWIKKSLGIKNKFHTIKVDQYDIADIQKKASEFDFSGYNKKIISITGGTKLMSLEIYNYFKNINNSEIYYVVNEGEYTILHPKREENTFKFRKSVDLNEYFNAYGFDKKESSLSGIEKNYTYQFFKWFTEEKTETDNDILKSLREWIQKGNKKKINISDVKGLDEFLSSSSFPYKNNTLTKKEIRYLTGNWLEEYIYHKIKEKINENILCGVTRKGTQTENEFDVVFLHNNQLNVIECKTYINSKEKKSLPKDTIYKLDSTLKDFGLRAKSYIVTLNKKEEINDADSKRAKDYNIKFITLEDLQEDDFVNKFFLKNAH